MKDEGDEEDEDEDQEDGNYREVRGVLVQYICSPLPPILACYSFPAKKDDVRVHNAGRKLPHKSDPGRNCL